METLGLLALLGVWIAAVSYGTRRLFAWLEPAVFPTGRIVFKNVQCEHATRQAEGTHTWIRDCPSCGTSHRASLILFADNPPAGTTHWFFCPVHLDPVPVELTLRMGPGPNQLVPEPTV